MLIRGYSASAAVRTDAGYFANRGLIMSTRRLVSRG